MNPARLRSRSWLTFSIVSHMIWRHLPSETCRKMNICIEILRTAAEWCHFIKMDPSRASESFCFGIVFSCTRTILRAFWAVVRIQSRPCTIFCDTHSRTHNDIVILIVILAVSGFRAIKSLNLNACDLFSRTSGTEARKSLNRDFWP